MKDCLINDIRKRMLIYGVEPEVSVCGDSMEPFISDGDKIRILYSSSYHVGDIVVFVYGGRLLAHRIVDRDEGRYYCKGDNCFRIESIPLHDILGKVYCVNDRKIQDLPVRVVRLSRYIGRLYEKKKDVNVVRNTVIHKIYRYIVWRKCDKVR